GLLVGEQLERLADLQLALLLLAPAEVLEHALDLLGELFHAGRREDLGLHRRGGDLDVDLLVVELALAQLLAEFLPRGGILRRLGFGVEADRTRRRQQGVEHAVLGGIQRAVAHRLHRPLAAVLDRDLHQVADDRVHITADVADLGELGRLDLDEGGVGQARQAARDLGLADAGGADHQDVLGGDLATQRLLDLSAAPAVAQRDGDGLLGLVLADDVLVEFGDDLRRGHLGHAFALNPALRWCGGDWCRCTGRRRSKAPWTRPPWDRIRCSRLAPAPRPGRTPRRCRWRRCPVRARARRR